MMGFFTNPKVAFGPGAFEQIAALPLDRVTILAAPPVANLDPVVRLTEWLTEHRTRPERLAGPDGPPTVEAVDRLREGLVGPPGLVIAVGGGGLIDAAKALRARLARPDLSLAQWTPLTEVRPDATPSLVAIPTTGGSGSEMSGSAHLLEADGTTLELTHRSLTPDWALLDPEFARSLPGPEALATGMEVVAHGIEALASEWANSFTDALARDAIAQAVPALQRLARQPKDPESRTQLYYAASRAGLASANSSLGLAHSWARALLPELPRAGYGRLLAAALPTIAEYNFPSRRDVYETVVPLLSAGGDGIGETFGQRLASIARRAGLPSDLRAAGAEPETLRAARDRVVRRVLAATSTVANPRVPSAPEAGRLLDSMVLGLPRRPQ